MRGNRMLIAVHYEGSSGKVRSIVHASDSRRVTTQQSVFPGCKYGIVRRIPVEALRDNKRMARLRVTQEHSDGTVEVGLE